VHLFCGIEGGGLASSVLLDRNRETRKWSKFCKKSVSVCEVYDV
jgi:hypothetical protein